MVPPASMMMNVSSAKAVLPVEPKKDQFIDAVPTSTMFAAILLEALNVSVKMVSRRTQMVFASILMNALLELIPASMLPSPVSCPKSVPTQQSSLLVMPNLPVLAQNTQQWSSMDAKITMNATTFAIKVMLLKSVLTNTSSMRMLLTLALVLLDTEKK